MPNATRSENRGFEENSCQTMLPGDVSVGEKISISLTGDRLEGRRVSVTYVTLAFDLGVDLFHLTHEDTVAEIYEYSETYSGM